MKKLMPQPMIIPTSQGIFPFPFTEEDVKKYLVKIPRQTIKIVFFGSDSWSIHVLKALEDSSKGRSASSGNFDVIAVVCAPNSPVSNYFKGLILTPVKLDSDFLNSLSRAKSKDQFSTINPDLFVVASYGKIIPKSILDVPKFGALNIHPSLLPKYRGSSPVPETILNGDKSTGVTIIKMDEKMDHGDIVFTKEISLSGKEDFPTLINLLFQEGAESLVKIIPEYIARKIKPVEQKHDVAIYCPLLTRNSGYFDLNNPPSPEKLDRIIRAYYPWPGVWCKWNGKIVKFLPGDLIQMEGKKPLTMKDFLNGYPDFPLKSITIDTSINSVSILNPLKD